MAEADRYAHLPEIEFDPDDDSNPYFEPLSPGEAFPLVEFRNLLSDPSKNSEKLNKLAAMTEVVEYFAHRYWHGNRLAHSAETPEEKNKAYQAQEYQEAKKYLRDYGYLGAKSVREMLKDKYKFKENDLFGFDDVQITEAYFEAFSVPAFSMSDNLVQEEMTRAREGGSIWEIIRMGDYVRADSLLRHDVDEKYPPHKVLSLQRASSSLTN